MVCVRPTAVCAVVMAAGMVFSGCSFGASQTQNLVVRAQPEHAEIFINGAYAGTGSVTQQVPRRESAVVSAQAEGYITADRRTSTTLSETGVLDIVGGLFLLVPFLGLISEGAYAQSPDMIVLNLQPNNRALASASSPPPAPTSSTVQTKTLTGRQTITLPSNQLTEAAAARYPAPEKETQQPLSQQPAPQELPPPPPNPLATESGNGYAILVGISRYQYAGQAGLTNLGSAAADAEAMYAYLTQQLGWPRGNVKLLVDEEATFRNVNSALGDWLNRVDAEDSLVFFWAGHGYGDPSDDRRVYFAVHDTEYNKPATGVEMSYIKQKIRERNPRNVISFLDACHSGAFVLTRNGERAIGPMVKNSLEGAPAGWLFFAGAQTSQVAYEVATLENGVFTHYLMRGLRGEADGQGPRGIADGTVTMAELQYFLTETARHDALDRHGVDLEPVVQSDSWRDAIWDYHLR